MVIPVTAGVGSVVQLLSFPMPRYTDSLEANDLQAIHPFSMLSSIFFIYQFLLYFKGRNHIPHAQGFSYSDYSNSSLAIAPSIVDATPKSVAPKIATIEAISAQSHFFL